MVTLPEFSEAGEQRRLVLHDGVEFERLRELVPRVVVVLRRGRKVEAVAAHEGLDAVDAALRHLAHLLGRPLGVEGDGDAELPEDDVRRLADEGEPAAAAAVLERVLDELLHRRASAGRRRPHDALLDLLAAHVEHGACAALVAELLLLADLLAAQNVVADVLHDVGARVDDGLDDGDVGGPVDDGVADVADLVSRVADFSLGSGFLVCITASAIVIVVMRFIYGTC